MRIYLKMKWIIEHIQKIGNLQTVRLISNKNISAA